MSGNNYKIKLLIIYDILSKYTDENHAMNTDELISELEKRGISVARKVLAQDIATLNEYGYEVLSYKKKYHYYYVVNRPLETAEVVMLADVIKSSKLSTAQKKHFIENLASTICSHQAKRISKNIISLGTETQSGYYLLYNVDAIDRAIEQNRQISFLYFDYDSSRKKVYRRNGERYVVNPIVMVWNNDNYYLLCIKENYDNVSTYRIDKIDNIEILESERQPNQIYENFNTEEYRKQVFSMFRGELQTVNINFAKEMLSDIYDKFGNDLRIITIDDNTYSASVKVQTSRTFFAWIVGTQGKVKISSPSKVLKEFNEFVNVIKQEY